MCCSRDHYPSEVGIHEFDPATNHYHLVLPGLGNVGICVTPGTVMWRDFGGRLARADAVTWQGFYEAADLIAMGIAEGGRLSRQLVQQWLAEYAQGMGMEPPPTQLVFPLNRPWPIEVPTGVEWHEWLMHQATRELVDIQAENERIEQAMKKHLREAV